MGRLATRPDAAELWSRRAAAQGYLDVEAAKGGHRGARVERLQRLRRLAAGAAGRDELQYVDWTRGVAGGVDLSQPVGVS